MRLTLFPRMYASGSFQNRSPSCISHTQAACQRYGESVNQAQSEAGLTALVWYTSLMVRFIKLSHATRCPLNVSPFFSSTSCVHTRASAVLCAPLARQRGAEGKGDADHGLVLRGVQQR